MIDPLERAKQSILLANQNPSFTIQNLEENQFWCRKEHQRRNDGRRYASFSHHYERILLAKAHQHEWHLSHRTKRSNRKNSFDGCHTHNNMKTTILLFVGILDRTLASIETKESMEGMDSNSLTQYSFSLVDKKKHTTRIQLYQHASTISHCSQEGGLQSNHGSPHEHRRDGVYSRRCLGIEWIQKDWLFHRRRCDGPGSRTNLCGAQHWLPRDKK